MPRGSAVPGNTGFGFGFGRAPGPCPPPPPRPKGLRHWGRRTGPGGYLTPVATAHVRGGGGLCIPRPQGPRGHVQAHAHGPPVRVLSIGPGPPPPPPAPQVLLNGGCPVTVGGRRRRALSSGPRSCPPAAVPGTFASQRATTLFTPSTWD